MGSPTRIRHQPGNHHYSERCYSYNYVEFATLIELFFFSSRRRHTRFDCDWSSDVCSSDLRSMQPHRLTSVSATCSTVCWTALKVSSRLRSTRSSRRPHRIRRFATSLIWSTEAFSRRTTPADAVRAIHWQRTDPLPDFIGIRGLEPGHGSPSRLTVIACRDSIS